MFHSEDNLFFGRLQDGSVRILKFDSNVALESYPKVEDSYPNALFDVTIKPNHWASIIASVSFMGEEHYRYYKAMEFHNEKE